MTEQPTALRLAQELDAYHTRSCHKEAAAELRRLSEIETLYLAAMRGRHAMSEELLALTAQIDALLAALRPFAAINASIGFTYKDVGRARAAIKTTEGGSV